jgi:subtilisin family serine protease
MRRCLVLAVLVLLAVLVAAAPAAAAGDPRRGEQWGLDLVEADAAHAVSQGAGAEVAIVDSGVQADHPDLAGRVGAGRDFVDGDATPQDGDGHGTHVLGIVGAATGNGIGVSSVAPLAALMPVRVLGDDGSGTTANVARGIDYAREHGADVINLSLGADVPLLGSSGGRFDAAVRRALAAGIVVVAAAGNSGLPVCEQPAASDGLLCVGAVDRRRQRSFFSSFGRGLGLVAPGGSGASVTGPEVGEDVLSTYRGSRYVELAGTSQAAPHVSGVAALLVARGVRGQAAASRILSTATDLGAPGQDPEYGAGLVDARAAAAGLGGGGGEGGGGGAGGNAPGRALSPFVHLNRRQGARRLLRDGLRARVRSAHAGRVRVRVRATARGRTVARGSRRVAAGRTVTVVARLTASGRRLARRRPAAFGVRVRVLLPGERRDRVRRASVRG